jgi:hypothetical protein
MNTACGSNHYEIGGGTKQTYQPFAEKDLVIDQ